MSRSEPEQGASSWKRWSKLSQPRKCDKLRQDLKSLFQGAIRLTLEMVLEEELKAMVGAPRATPGAWSQLLEPKEVAKAA